MKEEVEGWLFLIKKVVKNILYIAVLQTYYIFIIGSVAWVN